MATWISLAVLSALAVSTLSLPGPDGAYNIPQVGTGRRSQYYVLHNDGTYKYGHDTGEGAFESARSTSIGQQQGNFGYVDPDGNSINLQYEAGEGGFVARGDHLPAPHPDFNAAHAEARARPPFKDPLANSNGDATYNFQFAEDGQSRSEQSDSNGNVRGSYSYTDENGQTRTISYTAGRNTGFVVESNDLPVSPDAPGAAGSTPANTRLTGGRVSSSSFRATGTSGSSAFRPSPSSQGFSTSSGGTSYTPPRSQRPSSFDASVRASSSSPSLSNINPDGSYSFSYNAGNHVRSESADSNLNVEGQFSFVADDGVTRSVNYEAGANRGFLASGDHLPVAPSANLAGGAAASKFRGQTSTGVSGVQTYSTPSASSQTAASRRFSGQRPSTGAQTYTSPSTRGAFEEAKVRSDLRPDGSYNFAYDTSSHSRQESGDTDNNVDGDFAFVADDGQRRQINYEASSATGFIAEGDHIPTGPVVPGAPSGQPTGRIVPVKEVPFVDPLANSNADASYNFAFESDQYSRSESADADGNVQGTYTVVDDEGTRKTFRFRGGQGIGFEKEEVSSSRGAPPSRPSIAASSSNGGASSNRFVSQTRSPSTRLESTPSAGYSAPTSSSSSSNFRQASGFSPSSSIRSDVSEGFTLHQYDASKNPNKFGYVLKFD